MRNRIASWSGIAALAFLLSACNVVESQRVTLDTPPQGYSAGTPCASTLGSYALPKSFVRIKIGQKKGSAPEVVLTGDDLPVEVKKHPDPHLFFCLDHLNSNTSDDRISILKWPSETNDPKGSFLGAVLVNVTDQTAYIVRALIRTAFIAISGQPDFAPRSTQFGATEIVGDFEFDPFNQRETATINSRLTKLGFCVMLEDPMFNAPGPVQQYCDAPLKHAVHQTAFYKAYHKLEQTPADPFVQGILYRVPQPHRFMIYHRRDPAEEWQLQQTTTIQLENLSPVLSLRVSRAVFANRTMNFVFSEGALHTACLSKGSELLGFVDIPLEIARSIVAVPGAIAMVRINDVNSEKELIAAQTKLAQMQQSYMQAVLGNNPTVTADKAKLTPAPTVDLGVPKDITPLGAAVVWDTDLFGNALKNICRGDWS
jgi:hypothetical protein